MCRRLISTFLKACWGVSGRGLQGRELDLLQLVPDRAQELLPLLDIGRGLHAFPGEPVDHAEDAAALHGIGTGADDMADLGDSLDGGKDIDRERSVEKDNERVTRSNLGSELHF